MMSKRLTLVLAITITLAGCRIDDRMGEGGTASETTNHIAGVLYQGESAPAARTVVRLVNPDFNPLRDSLPAFLTDTTDANGVYSFRNPAPGIYQLEAEGISNDLHGFKEGFRYTRGPLAIPNLSLGPPGSLEVSLPESLWAAGGFVFIPGTTYAAYIGESRRTILGPLPAMEIRLLAYAASAASPWVPIARNILLGSGETAEITVPADTVPVPKVSADKWIFRLNTTVTGAGIAEDQVGFPLLLRLDSSNFDFSAVAGGGTGIGFFKPDGTPLPFEIERWDRFALKAEIWIRADTVKGNSDAQTIQMRLVPEAPAKQGPEKTGPAVFDPADGFEGVWHLGGGGLPGNRHDATGNGHWAVPVYFSGEGDFDGQVGKADYLGTINEHLDLGVINLERTFTLSAWVRPGNGSHWTAIVQKPAVSSLDDSSAYRWRKGYALWQYGNGDTLGITASNGSDFPFMFVPAGPGPWTLITGTFDGRTLALYRDGVGIGSYEPEFPGLLEQNDLHTSIGGYIRTADGHARYSGMVDEVRIEKVARSGSWIRLCHENQKSAQTLIRLVR
jgi:hypothetical protein